MERKKRGNLNRAILAGAEIKAEIRETRRIHPESSTILF